jgi:short-subunit dehydrogenase
MASRWGRAVVTGASSGIGTEFARLLAAEGTDLVLVARDQKRLKALADDLRDRHGVDVEVLKADLAKKAQVAKVEARLAAPTGEDDRGPVDLLVNNAGFGTYGEFADLPLDEEEREIDVNVVAVVRLTHAALRSMRPRREGTVLNVSSMATFSSTPRNAVYAATKAFVTSFSEAVHEELRGTPVSVTAVLPGFTRTEFQERAGISEDAGFPEFLQGMVWQDAEEVAREGLDAAAAGKALVVTGTGNKVAAGIAGFVPRGVVRRSVSVLSRRF